MLTRTRMLLLLGAIVTMALACVGLAQWENETSSIARLTQQAPVLKGAVELADWAGETLTAWNRPSPQEEASGFLFPATVNHFTQAQAQWLEQHPVLKGTVRAVGEATKAGVSAAGAAKNYWFPNAEEREKRLYAKAQMDKLLGELAQKEQQLHALQNEVTQTHNQIRSLEKIADPMTQLKPDGFDFRALIQQKLPDAVGVQNNPPKTPTTSNDCRCP